MKRFSRRTYTAGTMRLCSARKDGATLPCNYFMWIGSKWYLFDIREVAKASGHGLPSLMTIDEIRASRAVTGGYEKLLQRDLERVTLWCVATDAADYVKRLV